MGSNAGLELSEELVLCRKSAGIFAGFALAVLSACGGGGGDGPTPPSVAGGNAGGSTPPPAASAPAVGSATLGAAGGEVTTTDQNVRLRVPANSVSASTLFSIVQAPADAASGVVGGSVVSLSPPGITFAAPVEITYQYEPSWLAEEWSPSALALARWTGAGWSTVPTSVATENRTLIAKVSAFSTWAPVVQSGTNSSPDYTWEISENCLRTTDSEYNQKLARLGLALFGVDPGPSVGCVTGPYLESGYSKFIASMQHHAGLDFRASEGTKVYAPADGNVVFQALDAAAGSSTLTIESSVDGVVYRLAFLHCMSHEQVRGGVSIGDLSVGSSVKAGDQICKAGKVGAFASHLHFEVKRTTQDAGNLKAMSGSRGSCASSSFVGGWNSETSAYDLLLTSPGCSLADIRSGSVDPVSIMSQPASVEVFSNDWSATRQRAGAGGHLLWNSGAKLYSYGSTLMESSDRGATWKEKLLPLGAWLMTSFAGRIVVAVSNFRYISSSDSGASWTSTQRFPGVPSSFDTHVNTADCFVSIGSKLYAKSGNSGIPIWVSSNGLSFRTASGSEVAEFNAEVASKNYGCTGHVYPNSPNLLDGYDKSAVASKYFRQNYEQAISPRTGATYWKYSLDISSDKNNWERVVVNKDWVSNYVAEVGSNRFVNVGYWQDIDGVLPDVRGTFLSTDGGYTWKDVGGGPKFSNQFWSAAANNESIVVVGTHGAITRSGNSGGSWTDPSPATTSTLWSVAYGNGVFVAVGDGGTIVTSSNNGVTWSIRNSGTSDAIRSVVFGDNKFVAVTPSGLILSSADGTIWSSSSAGLAQFAPLTYWPRLAFGSGGFVIAAPDNACVGSNCTTGNSGIFVSRDSAKTWKRISNVPSANGVAFGGGVFLLQYGFEGNRRLYKSSDGGLTWSSISSTGNVSGPLAFGAGIFAIPGYKLDPNGGVITGIDASTDGGQTWVFKPVGGGFASGLNFTGTRWVLMGESNLVMVSSP